MGAAQRDVALGTIEEADDSPFRIQFAGPVVALNDLNTGFSAIAGTAWGFGMSSFVVSRVAAVVTF